LFHNATFFGSCIIHILHTKCVLKFLNKFGGLRVNLPTTTIVAQPFNVIKWQLKFNPVA